MNLLPDNIKEDLVSYLNTVNLNIVSLKLIGSRSERLGTEDSDWDVKGTYIPTAEELLTGKARETIVYKNEDGSLEVILTPISKFFTQLTKGNFENLLYPHYRDLIPTTREWKEIELNIHKLAKTSILGSSLERTRSRINRYLHEVRTGVTTFTAKDNLHGYRDILRTANLAKGTHPYLADDLTCMLNLKHSQETDPNLMVDLLRAQYIELTNHMSKTDPSDLIRKLSIQCVHLFNEDY